MEKNYFRKAFCLFGAIVGAVIILLVMIRFLGYSLQKEAKETPKEEAVVESEIAKVMTLADSINLLNAKVNDLSKKLEECTQEAAKKIAAAPKAKPAVPAAPAPQKVVVEVVIKEPAAPAPVSTPRVEQPIVRSVAAAPTVAPAPQQGKVIACFRTNGSSDQHFPHYAIDRGASVANAVNNGQKGYNYEFSPVQSVSGNVPGVTLSGVYFIPKEYLERYLNMSGESLKYVDVICDGNWGGVRMSLQGDYYVYNSR